MIELALSRSIKNARFLTSDFLDFRTDDKFDGILAWDSFFHFPKYKQNLIYARVAELLNPRGYFVFTHGNEEGEITDEMMGEQFYYSCLSKERVLQLLKKSGFEIQFVYEDFKERDADRALAVLAKKSI
jgi:predicted TPR repeat methyltransferase